MPRGPKGEKNPADFPGEERSLLLSSFYERERELVGETENRLCLKL